ncbi:DUF167 domain-containing protein [Mycolicibacterium sp. 3033]|nr:DUF167 domain-containing protein [Mycolicibacterium aurantiacum]
MHATRRATLVSRARSRLNERAVDGKANEAVHRQLAEHLGVPRRDVQLISGETSRLKRFRVE